jgi:hypothetical protein
MEPALMRNAFLPKVLGTPFTEVVSFGDSFSDNGFINGHGFQRATNTWTWVEYLSQMIGLPHDNWAFGGAMSNLRNQGHPPEINWSGLSWQVEEYLKTTKGDDISHILFTIMCGSNDYWGGQHSAGICVQNMVEAIVNLYQAGARHVLYRETCTVIMSPGYLSGEWADYHDGWKNLVDETNVITRKIFQVDLPNDYPALRLYYLSTDQLFTKIKNGEHGYKFEIIDRQWMGTYDFPEPFKYMWWDQWHPMGQVHLLAAQESVEHLRNMLPLIG